MVAVVPVFPTTIISGGQTGADRAGLDFAISVGIAHGGWCPRGRRAEDGVIPAIYQLQETSGSSYAIRTERNVKDSDATLLFNCGDFMSPGTALTQEMCVLFGRPRLLIRVPRLVTPAAIPPAAQAVAEFLAQHTPGVLNVAGNRESKAPGISDFVKQVLAGARDIRTGKS